VVERLARSLPSVWRKKTRNFEARLCRLDDSEVLLVTPLTFMNRSGVAMAEVKRRLGADESELLVVCDDTALPLGRLRLRKKGSAGGHKGLQSVIDELGTQSFARLRIGVGSPTPGEALEDYVLKRPGREERKGFSQAVTLAAEATLVSVAEGVDVAMNRFN
jgi:PTH1 family peptidyl-tRNA hydrolase